MADTQPTVIYADVQDYPGYRIGSDGSIWSCRRGTWRKRSPVLSRRGYLRIGLTNAKGMRLFFVHRLVLEAFVGPCPEGLEACHSPDRDRTNNRLSNLRWGTREDNEADKVAHGTGAKGETHGMRLLSEEDVISIRELRVETGLTYKEIGALFGVSGDAVKHIVRRDTWKHV